MCFEVELDVESAFRLIGLPCSIPMSTLTPPNEVSNLGSLSCRVNSGQTVADRANVCLDRRNGKLWVGLRLGPIATLDDH